MIGTARQFAGTWLTFCSAPPQIQGLQDEKEEVQEELEAAQKELGAERAASATLRRQVLHTRPLTSTSAHIRHVTCRSQLHMAMFCSRKREYI